MNINSKECSRCGTCVAVCKESALFIRANSLGYLSDRCTGCGDCTKVCAVYAISRE